MTQHSPYTVPEHPDNPEAAALELIVRLPADILDSAAFTAVLQEYAGVLHAENCFTGRSCGPGTASSSSEAFEMVDLAAASAVVRREVLRDAVGHLFM